MSQLINWHNSSEWMCADYLNEMEKIGHFTEKQID